MGGRSGCLSAWDAARIRTWILGCVGLAIGVWTRSAEAAALSYQAQLKIEAVAFAPVVSSATGSVAVASDGSFTLPASIFDVDATVTGATTARQVLTKGIWVFHNGPGMFGGPALPGGPMPLLGKVKLFAKPALAFPPATLTLTKGFSTGTGTAMVSNGMTVETLSLFPSAVLGSWLASKVVQSSTAPSGTKRIVIGKRTRTGFDHRTSMGVGAMNLVIPVYLDRKVNQQFVLSAPVTGSLSITFTPEPARMGLEGATAATLVWLGLSRTRARRVRRG